ncbi:RHS repeat-associated core domain-containing protein [Maridesulfovibrio ferrireducens]|uniref:RHS repeat-associated core domain-containing protein n=1 Tax=Maridesulfovibrio ferrireducens TaxID=246191 RepID=A0A1G9CHP9_9BACT|nr:RHS repeat-associated core domain-containing protein [Maridesulfovibrio ferrireducens]SDK51211.1 RHS repeat-associated core domain-containing protein [Maridesulfovibrio ferrireducens]
MLFSQGKVLEKYLWQDLTTLVAVTDGEGLHPKVFTYNEEGDPVSMTFEGRTFLFATNQVGTIFMVADERGYDVKRIIYDSFGNVLLDSGISLEVCLGFAAGLTDKETGLVHFGYREYCPTIGRFITPDPIGLAGGDVDVYGYCLDDPINFHDRTGLAGKSENEEKESYSDKIIKKIPGFKRATEIAIEEVKKRGKGNHNNEGDAMRHAEWSRRMTNELGSARAWAFGVAHEIEGLVKKGQPWGEAMMDLKNNAEGRAASSEKRPVDRSKLQKKPKNEVDVNPYNDM